jgi:hypothetical protein
VSDSAIVSKLECEKEDVEFRPHSIATYKSFLRRVRAEWGDWRVEDLASDIPVLEKWGNYSTLSARPTVSSPTASPRASVELRLLAGWRGGWPGMVLPGMNIPHHGSRTIEPRMDNDLHCHSSACEPAKFWGCGGTTST